MYCKACKVLMKPGTTYEIKDERVVSSRFDECPKCHFRKYNRLTNVQEPTAKELIRKKK